MIVYLDLAVFLNFLVDFFLLLGTNRLSGFPMSPLRSAFAAMVGGAYGGACILNGFRFLCGLLWRCVFLILICIVAFGFRHSTFKRGGIFIILSMSLTGIVLVVGRIGFLALLLCCLVLFVLSNLIFGDTVGSRTYVPLQLTFGCQSLSMIALRDSGNMLRDPITGEQVFILDRAAASALTGLTAAELSDPLNTVSSQPIPGLRLIPFRTVGCENGILLALRFDNVRIGASVCSAVVAFSPHCMSKDYQALVPVDVY